MKTVLQIIPALGTGGAEQACVDVAAALVARGDRALVVSSGGWRVEELEKAGGKHIWLSAHTKNPAKIIKNAFWLANYIKEEKVDIVHARSRAPAWSAKIACGMTGCPYVTTFHAAYNFSSSIKKIYNRVMAKGDCVIAISQFIAKHVYDNYRVGSDRLRVINRGTDLSLFDPRVIETERTDKLARKWEIERDRKIVIFPARLSPIKGHQIIIEAMEVLNKQEFDLPLVLFIGDDQGRTTYTQTLKAKIANAVLGEHIKLVGACEDMAAAYAMADLVVAPSQVPEGFGRTPVESMAMGVPVIASALGAVLDTVDDGETGWLVPHDDADAWAVYMKTALSMDEAAREAMAKTARKHVEDNFSLPLMIQKTLDVYDELV